MLIKTQDFSFLKISKYDNDAELILNAILEGLNLIACTD